MMPLDTSWRLSKYMSNTVKVRRVSAKPEARYQERCAAVDAAARGEVGTDHDTSAFGVESIRQRWNMMGRQSYPNARRLLITDDSGESNRSHVRLWKLKLQRLVSEFELEIPVFHFPQGTSSARRGTRSNLACSPSSPRPGAANRISRGPSIRVINSPLLSSPNRTICQIDGNALLISAGVDFEVVIPRHNYRRAIEIWRRCRSVIVSRAAIQILSRSNVQRRTCIQISYCAVDIDGGAASGALPHALFGKGPIIKTN
jgi:Rhodopirellula transposase DDE domain